MTVTAESPSTKPPSTERPLDDAWCVLSSGALAYRQPPTKTGRPVWLDALRCVRLCEHGHSATQIHHWHCAARPRVKPEWIECNCTHAKGLCMDAKEPPPEMPADVPPYHAVLWRDAQPTLLEPNGVWAVKVPGKPKGQEVYLDGDGTPCCAHGFSVSQLRAWRARERAGAAAPHRADRPRPCQCTTKGLRLERFGSQHRHWPSQQRKRKINASDDALAELVGNANCRVAR